MIGFNNKLTVAYWNIEKTGVSSTQEKQKKVSQFIDYCCNYREIDVLFLCEIHSARSTDFEEHLRQAYGSKYVISSHYGGHSNGYTLMYKIDSGIKPMQDQLQGLNREILVLLKAGFLLGLAHFKSGQTGLTSSQLKNTSGWLDGASNNKAWAIMGDLNWNYDNFNLLNLPSGTIKYTCFDSETQKSGNVLDWCMAGSGLNPVKPDTQFKTLPTEMFDMTGPDHKPVIFHFEW